MRPIVKTHREVLPFVIMYSISLMYNDVPGMLNTPHLSTESKWAPCEVLK